VSPSTRHTWSATVGDATPFGYSDLHPYAAGRNGICDTSASPVGGDDHPAEEDPATGPKTVLEKIARAGAPVEAGVGAWSIPPAKVADGERSPTQPAPGGPATADGS
jgi:hypothetical protein